MLPDDELLLLISRCNAGSNAAWEEFYGRYNQAVRNLVLARAHWSAGDVEDVVQEVFLKYTIALRQYDGTRPIIPYLLAIARRTTISEYRKRSALKRDDTQRTQLGPAQENDMQIPATLGVVDYRNPEHELLVAEQSTLVQRALIEASASCRELLRLKYDEDLSYKEIAEKTGIAATGLRVQVHRCLKLLARKCGIVHKEAERND